MNILYGKRHGVDARRKQDAPQDNSTTNGNKGSISKKNKKNVVDENRVLPIIELDRSNDE